MSLHTDIQCCIDECKVDDGFLSARGWAFHREQGCRPIRARVCDPTCPASGAGPCPALPASETAKNELDSGAMDTDQSAADGKGKEKEDDPRGTCALETVPRLDVSKAFHRALTDSGWQVRAWAPEAGGDRDENGAAGRGGKGCGGVSVVLDMLDGNTGEWLRFAQLRLSTPLFSCSVKPLQTLIVVDDFYEDPDSVRAFALEQRFVEHKAYHKGRRTEALFRPECVRRRFEQLLGRRIDCWERYGTNGTFQVCTADDQLVIHTDSQQYAGVVFLTPDAPPETGTSLWRSKNNGLMRFYDTPPARATGKDEYALHAEAFAGGFADFTKFDLMDKVANLYNRAVLWDAKIVHSASAYFGKDLHDARLFQLFFFDLLPE